MQSSVKIALGVAIVAILWILSGQIIGSSSDEDAASNDTTSQKTQLTKVQVTDSRAESVRTEIVLQGRSVPSRAVNLRAETKGTVRRILAERGQALTRGQVIAELDLDERRERLAELEALLNERQLIFDSAQKLVAEGFRSSTDLARSEAAIKQAQADITALQHEIDNTTLRAPFAGVLQDRMIEVGDFLREGDDVARIVDLDPLYVLGEVSERDVANIREGQTTTVEMITGETREGVIHYIAAEANEITRTYQVEALIDNPIISDASGDQASRIRAGLTAEIQIPMTTIKAHKITPAMLTLSDDGDVGVKLITSQDIVRFVPITIVQERDGGIWVTSKSGSGIELPAEARLISVGQEFVKAGEQVDPREDLLSEDAPDEDPLNENPLAP